jgi:serine/threonine-protein kinase HipA
MGEFHCQQSRSGEIFSFTYDEAWLASPETFAFDPDLALVAGHQYPASDRANFGIFLDSSPDRWGRVLMQRRENSRARQEGRRARSLAEWDFSVGRAR